MIGPFLQSPLSQTQSRLLALSLLCLLVGIIFLGAVLPVWRIYQSNQQAIEEVRGQITRFSRIAAARGALAKQVRQLEKGLNRSRYTLSQESTTLAAAALQERVKAIVEQSGGKLISTQDLPVVEEGPFQRVTVNVRMRVDTDALQTILYELESGLPLLLVDNMMILSRTRGRYTRAPRAGSQSYDLDVRFDISGLMGGDEGTGRSRL